ncbi:hypothetical protein [Pseudarthrobacter sulfonivorans]|uniref:glycosyltransferase family 39 protein n=1 Tax=Pseudarthrobacter sulfonivorans TaxID=121292 RepID=UPI00285663A7|nr:hypothetical protein [Pseudarthrobacter sulfonivorans]MDR6417075.1 mannosyltransferase [Pseudarthrobacter sulfonivorans]
MLSLANRRSTNFFRVRGVSARRQLTIIAVCAFASAMIGIGTPGIGFDEAATWWAANLPWSGLFRLLSHQDLNFAPYYTFMHFWMGVSDSLWWLRVPSAVGGAVGVAATAGLSRYLFGARTAWIAALLMITAYSWVRFSQEVRPYSWSLAVATLATWAFVALCDRYVRRTTAIYLALMIFLPATHLFAGMASGIHFIYAVARRDRRMAVVAACGALPTAVAALFVLGQVKQVSWLTSVTMPAAVQDLVGQSKAVWYLPVALAALIAFATYRWLAAGTVRSRTDIALFASWWVLPPVLLWCASELVTPVYTPRYVFWTLPAMVIPAAALVVRLAALGRARVAVAAGLVCLLAATLPSQISARAADGHLWAPQQFAAVMGANARPGDALVNPDFLALTLRYHLRGQHFPEPLVASPAEQEGTFMDVQVPVRFQAERLQGYSRVWILAEVLRDRPLPVGFCARQSWTSAFNIARLTLATPCP